jgi:hypothetical protein
VLRHLLNVLRPASTEASADSGRSAAVRAALPAVSAAGIGALDFLVVPTINFRLLSVLVILRHERRRLISLSVTDHPTAEWIAQQITEAFPWDEACPYRKPHPYWTDLPVDHHGRQYS